MILNPQPNYPGTRSYVLKLHRDAAPQQGEIFGRLENMASGRHFEFNSGEQLLACLMSDTAPTDQDTNTTQHRSSGNGSRSLTKFFTAWQKRTFRTFSFIRFLRPEI